MQKDIQELVQLIKSAKLIVGFTGAGISTASGIPDFRSAGGFFDQLSGQHYSGEEALSVPFFKQQPELFFENFRTILDFPDAEPNAGHLFFKQLEDSGKTVTVVTQNIDNLHEKAGNKHVLAVHGNATKWQDAKTGQAVSSDALRWDKRGIAVDEKGQRLKPQVILYGDRLDERVMEEASKAIREADLLIVVGTSLNVYPAAYLIDDFRGEHLVLINQTTVADMKRFDLVVQTDCNTFLKEVTKQLS